MMLVRIEYKTKVLGIHRRRCIIRDTVEEAVKFFNWRYGHKIISINGQPVV